MFHEKINLKSAFPNLNKQVELIAYCPDNFSEYSSGKKRKTIILLPGGAYSFLSEREDEVVALRLIGYDLNVFVLHYNLGPYHFPYPLLEGLAAVAYIRKNASKYHVDEDAICVMGFSAGGHFAATIAAYHHDQKFTSILNLNPEDTKVNGAILAYPVITMGQNTHNGTMENVTNNQAELIDFYSIEKHVTKQFPKTFIWTTHDDTIVDSVNTLLLANALKASEVKFELHYYPLGDHGTSLADKSCYNQENLDLHYMEEIKYFSNWIDLAIKFIKEII